MNLNHHKLAVLSGTLCLIALAVLLWEVDTIDEETIDALDDARCEASRYKSKLNKITVEPRTIVKSYYHSTTTIQPLVSAEYLNKRDASSWH